MSKLKLAMAALAMAIIPANSVLAQSSDVANDLPSEAPASPEELALARQIIDTSFPVELREEMFFATVDQMTTQLRAATAVQSIKKYPGMIAILDVWTAEYTVETKAILRSHIPSLMDGMTEAYVAMFTEQELRDIAAFVSTPSGQRFVQISPAVLAAPGFVEANQAYINEIMEMLPAAQQELRTRLQEYIAEQNNADSYPES